MSLFHQGNEDYYCLQSVFKLNYYLRHVGNLDTIAYHLEGEEVQFSYRGKLVPGLCDRNNLESPVSVYGGSTSHTVHSYQGIFRELNGIEMRIDVRNNAFSYVEKEVVIVYYQNNVLTGPYLELSLDNEVMTQGAYQQVDSTYIDTIPYINPTNFEPVLSYVQMNKYPLKIGTWVYRNRSGDTLKVEHYPEKYE